jgi:hypothetical protein
MKVALRKNAAHILVFFAVVFSLALVSCAANGFGYEHDPRLNPSAMADIVEDENAIYGFRPNGTGSLKAYAEYDWSDPEVVEQGRQDRIAYHESMSEMYRMLDEMTAEGRDIETIARAISAKRNELRLAAYKDDPEGLAQVKARNLEKYGHEEGPLPDEQFEKYRSWEMVLSKAFSTNSGMDACLGLYDDYYDLYVASGEVAGDDASQNGVTTAIVIIAAAVCLTAAAVFLIVRKRKTAESK